MNISLFCELLITRGLRQAIGGKHSDLCGGGFLEFAIDCTRQRFNLLLWTLCTATHVHSYSSYFPFFPSSLCLPIIRGDFFRSACHWILNEHQTGYDHRLLSFTQHSNVFTRLDMQSQIYFVVFLCSSIIICFP